MNRVIEQIGELGIVPVVVLEDVKDARPLAEALCEGGLPCAEVTFRTPVAADVIREMTSAFPQMLVGAGTVLTCEQVDAAIEAGARFIVSPGLNPKVVKYCLEKEIPIVPGINDPSGVEQALELGLSVVKFFPAEASGGLSMIQAMAAPYTSVKFMPTGGIHAGNIGEYLRNPKVIACGGSYMVNKELIKQGNFRKIKEETEKAVRDMLGFKISNIVFDGKQKEFASTQIGELFADAQTVSEGGNYIVITTDHMGRAKAYFERVEIEGVQSENGDFVLTQKQEGFSIRIRQARV